MQAMITISRDSNDRMKIRLVDSTSLAPIYEGSMTLSGFTRALTGEARILTETDRICTPEEAAKFGLNRIVKHKHCRKVSLSDMQSQREAVLEDFERYWKPNHFQLLDDGTGTQQPTQHHAYLICRWLTDEEIELEKLHGEVSF
ncbi:hypothetical protein [Marinobacter salicampi]|uniref:hypothetical protein n=1 Tax=Marinobacter salicampi TaxID=435907 RepID=UPI00140ADDAC|nr:hypothetical protein [Marinobacter salicampi]